MHGAKCTHTYLYIHLPTHTHTYVYALKYAHNVVQLPNEITEFCLSEPCCQSATTHSTFHREFSKHFNPNLRPIAEVSVTVTYYETFIPFPPPLLPQ